MAKRKSTEVEVDVERNDPPYPLTVQEQEARDAADRQAKRIKHGMVTED